MSPALAFSRKFRSIFVFCSCISALLIVSTLNLSAQKSVPSQNADAAAAQPPEARSGAFLYKGIEIGMMADDVRKKLGEPKDKSDPQDLFMFGDDESAQFLYDSSKKVTAIMITYSGKMNGAPTAKEVFGENVPAKADGGIFKMVRYPKAGYWVSYNKIVGDDSIISIAMQKL